MSALVFIFLSIFLLGCSTPPPPMPPIVIENQAAFITPPIKATDTLKVTTQQPLPMKSLPLNVSKAISFTGSQDAAAFPPNY